MALLIASFVIVLGVFVFLLASEIKELAFYRARGWDFTEDSKIFGSKMYFGDSFDEQARVPNRKRVLYDKPITIVITLGFVIVLLWLLWPETIKMVS
ncbi:MAG TPA: hypothetical protein VMF90_03450 [Rhizobiaceae bacterium]|nr:hypothetical protein [Rhizobiaceae bacterium]